MRIMMPNAGVGKELADLLRAKLGIPEHVISFSVKFATESAITVECEYYPSEPSGTPVE